MRLASVVSGARAASDARSRLTSAKWLGALSLVVAASAGVVGTGYFQSPSPPAVTTATEEPIEAKSATSTESTARAAATSAPSPAAQETIDVMDLPPPPSLQLRRGRVQAPGHRAWRTSSRPSTRRAQRSSDEIRRSR